MSSPTATGFDRRRALAELGSDHFDVVVVGGGITGCGVALDAAARGLRTALVEAVDFGSGTSSRSSKLVHGGLRYLQQHDFRLVYEALAERQRLLQNAPHLVRPLPFLIPLFGKAGVVSRSVAQTYSTALWAYDLTGGLRIGKRHRRVSARTALEHFPDLNAERLAASFVYWDAQTDDARLTLAIARTAAECHGAVVANHLPVSGLLEDRSSGRLRGVRLADGTEVSAEVVVNAGGVWADEIDRLDPVAERGHPVGLRPAKGVHLTVRSSRLPCDHAAVLPVPGDRRTIFVVPWVDAGFTYIGTTDTDYEGPLAAPATTEEDRDYLLRAVNAWTSAELTPADVTGTWAGLRPLVRAAPSARTADLSRRHRVTASERGLVTVTGGKLTTYRAMAADTVNHVVRLLGRRMARSGTRRLPLWGADGSDHVDGGSSHLDLPEGVVDHLRRRYGGEAGAVAALASSDADLRRPLVTGLPYLRAEAVFAARYEMAADLADVLDRRTRASMLDWRAAAEAAPEVARLLGRELGWSSDEADAQARSYVSRLEADATTAGLALSAAPGGP